MAGISENISALRKKRGVTQDELGKALGVSMQAVSRWENGGMPDVALLPGIADYFGVSIDELFGRDGGVMRPEDAILKRLNSLPREERIEEGFKLCWEIQRGIAGDTEFRDRSDLNRYMALEGAHSRMDFDSGITDMSLDRKHNWFFISPEPECGRYEALYDSKRHTKLFRLLAEPDAYDALFVIMQRDFNPFTAKLLEKTLKITNERATEILDAFEKFKLVFSSILELDDEKIRIYNIWLHSFRVIPFLTMAREMVDAPEGFVYQSSYRKRPYIRSEGGEEKR